MEITIEVTATVKYTKKIKVSEAELESLDQCTGSGDIEYRHHTEAYEALERELKLDRDGMEIPHFNSLSIN